MGLLGAGAAAYVCVSKASGLQIAGGAPATQHPAIEIDPKPRFALSPYLYMQFMEPLGTTDGSVAAAWDTARDRWREDVIEVTKSLSPSLIRWGGCFCSYYRWKEGVGPRDERRPMLNLCWGGVETNQVGTAERIYLMDGPQRCRRAERPSFHPAPLRAKGRVRPREQLRLLQ